MCEIAGHTVFFPTFEDREQGVINAVGGIVPRRYAGPSLFFKDFMTIASRVGAETFTAPHVFITTNPQDCLAFGTPMQVLRASYLGGTGVGPPLPESLEAVLGTFNLRGHADQAIHTLSGGESVLLALAKAYVASAYADSLVISSPFTWLSPENSFLLKKVIDAYRSREKPVQILAMNGEDCDTPLETTSWERPASIPFTVQLLGVSLGLGDTVSATGTSSWQARFKDTSLVLNSPCLIVGNNGSGKSLFACALSRAIPFEGRATVTCRGRLGGARLLFQDVVNQTLMRSFVRIARDTSPQEDSSTTQIYQKLIRKFVEHFSRSGRDVPLIGHSEVTASKSLIEMKAILIASRLSGEPCSLILDEPEWGLSREAAEGLVMATITVAHEFGIPVLIISHKNWWAKMATSAVSVSKKTLPNNTLEVSLSLSEAAGGHT